jgi:hypothetical protein
VHDRILVTRNHIRRPHSAFRLASETHRLYAETENERCATIWRMPIGIDHDGHVAPPRPLLSRLRRSTLAGRVSCSAVATAS